MKKRGRVLIFLQRFIRQSETFVLSQAGNLRRHMPIFGAVSKLPSIDAAHGHECLAACKNRMSELLLKLTLLHPQFTKTINKEDVQLVHAHFEDGGVYGLRLARSLKVPIITTFHGFDATAADRFLMPNCVVRSLYRSRRRKLQRHGQLFLAVSQFIADALIGRGYPPERIRVLRIGVDVAQCRPLTPKIPCDELVLAMVGRCVPKKGFAYGLKAFAKISNDFPTARMVVVGDGPLRAELTSEARRLGLHRVEFLGMQSHARALDVIRGASLLLAPSVTDVCGDSEGLPIVICEAQACGVPVVATHHAGIPEAVIHKQTGLLSAERDVRGLSDSLGLLCSNARLRRSMSEAARRHAITELNIERQTNILEQLYEKCVNDHAETMICKH